MGGLIKLLVCVQEYVPKTSGMGIVVYNVVKKLEERGVSCVICSPNADIKLGEQRYIGRYGIFGILHYWIEVARYFRSCDFDAVWLHGPHFLLKNPFERFLVTEHTTYYGYYKNVRGSLYYGLSSAIEKVTLNNIKKDVLFTAVSPQTCVELQKIGIDQRRISYIPNGVDTKLFCPSGDKKTLRKKFGIDENSIIILSLGRLTHQKQPMKMVDIARALNKKNISFTMVIAGTGELFDKISEIIDQNNIKNIRLLGYVDEECKADLYRCSDYFLITSSYEGQPLSLLEAMSSGLPCIVSDIGNFKIVEEANCGIMLDFIDIDNASDHIYNYITKNNRDHSNNGRNYCVNNLDWSIIAKRYYALLFK